MVKIPETFICKEQRNQYKCLAINFNTPEECKKTCVGKCVGLKCKTPIVKKEDW